jgi:hypothetical protein
MPGTIAVLFPAEPPEGTKNTEAVAALAVGLERRISLITAVTPVDGEYKVAEDEVVS